ncbi:MAG TPA: Bax inhibitor-1/YccA family protein [Polyangia bacterium]
MLPQNASQPLNAGTFTPAQVAAEQAAFMRKVYAIMAFGLGATGLTALVVFNSRAATQFIFGTPGVYLGLIIAELVMVFTFASLARRMSAVGAAALFYIYAILNGLTLSVVFLIYTKGSIASTFFVTAGTFGAMSAYGYVTKRDLTGVGSFMMMGLFGLIIASIVNLFMRSEMIYWLTTYAGILIFVGLTAYDTQKIKQLNVIGNAGTDEDHKEAIHGALILYLDFVNLFLYLLRLLGRRR